MCEMVKYLLGAVVVVITLLACLLAHKLREEPAGVRQPTMRYTCPTAAELLVSPVASDGESEECIELTALPLLQPLGKG